MGLIGAHTDPRIVQSPLSGSSAGGFVCVMTLTALCSDLQHSGTAYIKVQGKVLAIFVCRLKVFASILMCAACQASLSFGQACETVRNCMALKS